MSPSSSADPSKVDIQKATELIPTLTLSEQIEESKRQVKEFFKGDDLSGLNFSTRRARKVSYNDVEELINQEFPSVKPFQNSVDEEESFSVSRRSRRIQEIDEVDSDCTTTDSLTTFSSGYKMKLICDEEDSPRTATSTEAQVAAVSKEVHMGAHIRAIASVPETMDQEAIRVTSRQILLHSGALQAKRRSNHKLTLNLGTKNSARKFGTRDQGRTSLGIQKFVHELGISSPAHCIFSLGGELYADLLPSPANVYIGHGGNSCPAVLSCLQSSIFHPEPCPVRVSEITQKAFKFIHREGFPQDTQRSCSTTLTTAESLCNNLLFFEEGLLINLVLTPKDQESQDYSAKWLEVYAAPGLDTQATFLKAEFRKIIALVSPSAGGCMSLEDLTVKLFKQSKQSISNKENVTLYERPSSSPASQTGGLLKSPNLLSLGFSRPVSPAQRDTASVFTFVQI